MGEPRIWVGRATPEVVSAVARAFEAEGDGRARHLFDWQYLNPGQEAFVALAHVSSAPFEDVVASYTSFPVPFQIGQTEVGAIQSIDTLTLAAYRGRGLLQRLGEATYEFARQQGISAVFGFPNDLILRPRETKLGWVTLDPLPMLLRPVGLRFPLSYLQRRQALPANATGTTRALVVSGFDPPPGAAAFLGGARNDHAVGVRFDLDYLRWRFSRPEANYRFRWETASSGEVLAFGASNLSLKRGQVFGQVMCLLAAPGATRAARAVLADLVADLKARGADVVMAWGNPSGDLRSRYRRAGFVDLPPRIRPITIHFGARALDPELAPLLYDRSRWRLSYLDSDTS